MGRLVCPRCGAANRTPEGKDARDGKCGRCGERLFQGRALDVDAGTLALHLRSTKGAGVLVDVWAPWCGPCRAMTPNFAAAAVELEPRVRLLKLDAEAEPQAAARWSVSGVPTLLLFEDGRLVARTIGLMTRPQIVAWTRQALEEAHLAPQGS